jgi:hypothetical protein
LNAHSNVIVIAVNGSWSNDNNIRMIHQF